MNLMREQLIPFPFLASLDGASSRRCSPMGICRSAAEGAEPQHEGLGSELVAMAAGSQKPGKMLPANYLAMLRTEESHGRSWEGAPRGWCCPICQRSNLELVYVGEQGKVIFAMRLVTGRGAWAPLTRICNHCESAAHELEVGGRSTRW